MGWFVEAIEEGKIVKVPEDYARREGLLILRKTEEVRKQIRAEQKSLKVDNDGRLSFDDYRRPLNWHKNRIVEDLIDNFHWHIAKLRRARGLTRIQLAKKIDVSEGKIKMIENGFLTDDNYVLINKLQDYFGVNLRKDKKDFKQEMRKLAEEKGQIKEEEKKESVQANDTSVLGDDIQII